MGTSRTAIAPIARHLSYLVAAILVLLPFHAFFSTWLGATFGHVNAWRLWKEVLIVFVALPMSLAVSLKDKRLKRWLMSSWISRLVGVYALWLVAVSAWSYHAHLVGKSALAYGMVIDLRFLGFFIICALAAASHDFLGRHWARLTLWPAAIVVVFGLAQKFLPANFLTHFGYGPATMPAYETVDAANGPPRLQSTLRGANPLGAYLVLAMPVWRGVFERQRKLAYGGLLAGLFVLFYSYSRSALIAAILSLAILAWWLAGKAERRWLVVFAASGLILLAGLVYADRNSSIVQEEIFHTSSHSSSRQTSNTVRRAALRQGWQDVVHQPLGRGVGTAGPASTHNNHPARIAENYYIQIAQEAGVVAAILFIGINFLLALQLWQQRQDLLPKVLLVSLLGISLVNLVSHAWADDTLSLLWWGLAGIAIAPAILRSKATEL